MGKLLINGGLKITGRVNNAGDDEGIVIDYADNSYAALTLGNPSAKRSVFYLSSSSNPFWRYNDGTSTYDIVHPGKAGTIALTNDLTWSNLSGKPSTFTPSSHTHNYLTYSTQLTTDESIDNFNAANTFQVATWNSTSTPGVSNGIIINVGWTSTHFGAQIAIDDDPTYYIALRQRNGDGWSSWKRIPMADGTGASGTWGINITGAWQGNNPSSFAAASHSHSYVPLAGGTMTGTLKVNAVIFGYRYGTLNTSPAFVFDKPGTYYTGMGAWSDQNTINFGPVSSDGNYTWETSYRQRWRFQGVVYATGNFETDNYGSSEPGSSTSGYGTVGSLYFKI